MDKSQAIQAFLDRFLPAYDQYTIPTGDPTPVMPYITYGLELGVFDSRTNLTVSVWYRTGSWKEVTEKASEIVSAISDGNCVLETDDGAIRLLPGNPAMIRMDDPDDDMVRRFVLNVSILDYTASYKRTTAKRGE